MRQEITLNNSGPVNLLLVSRNVLIIRSVREAVCSCSKYRMHVLTARNVESGPFPHNVRPLIAILDTLGLPLPLTRCLALLNRQYPDAKKIVLGDFDHTEMCQLLSFGIHGFVTSRQFQRKLHAALES